MADQIVLLARGDASRAQTIIAAFADRTGLERREAEGGAAFPLGPADHRVAVVHTLTEIDPEWSQHLALGDPRNPPAEP